MRCRSCPHKAHMGICTGRNGGTAYACGCCTVTVPSDEVQSLRREVERLTKERDEAEKREQWARSEVHELRAERDAAYAASQRSDEVHSEAMRAVRARAEQAEAERDEAMRARDEWARQCNFASEAQADAMSALTAARAQVERLRGALEEIADEGCETYSYADCCNKQCRTIARAALADAAGEESSK